MKTQTRIGLAAGNMEGWKGGRLEGWGARLRSCFRSPNLPNFQSSNLSLLLLTLALLAGLAPRAEAADLTLGANARLNNLGQLINTVGGGVLLTKTSGTGTQADPYVFDIDGNLNMGSYTIRGQTDNTTSQYSALWRVTGSVTGSGNFDSNAGWSYGGHVKIEAGGSIAVNRVNTSASSAAAGNSAGAVDLWAKAGSVSIASYIDTRVNCANGNAGAVTIRSEGPVSGQGIAISGSVNGQDGSGYSILAETAANNANTSAGNVSLYCQNNITLAAGISTRGNGNYFIDGAVLIRGDITDGTARAGTVSIGGTGGIRTDSGKTGGNVTIRANALQLTGGVNTTAHCMGTRTGNVDIDVLENATIGGSIDTRLLYRDFPQGSPGYVKIVARRTAVLGVDGQGYSIRTWPGTLYAGRDNTSASVAGDADVTLTGVDTSGEIYDPANPITSATSSIRVAGKIETGRWYNDNALGNIRITAVEVQLGGNLNHAALGTGYALTPALAVRYGVTTYGIVTHLRENGVYWNGSGGHNITYTTDKGAYTYTANVPYAGKVSAAVPGQIENRTEAAVTQTGATFRGRLLEDGVPAVTVSVRWAETEAGLTSGYSSYAWTAGAWGDNSLLEYSGASLTPSRDCYYTFVAQNTADTVLATPAQYLITGELTPATGDGTCGATVGDTATITISRPATCKDGPLTVNYALSGATSYVSASPASGFTLAAGVESQTITFTPLSPNMGAPLPVTLTMLAGAYPSDGLDSAAITVATAAGASLTANTDTSIGTAMDVQEDPPNTVAYSLTGSTYTYEFWASSLNLDGKKIYYNALFAALTRSVVLKNLAALTDSGAGWIDTSTGASLVPGGAVTVQAPGGITLNGANGSGYAIDSASTHSPDRQEGGYVTLMTSGGVSLSAGGIRTQGKTGGRIWITDGAGGSAGNVSIAGDLNAYSSADNRAVDGSVQVRGNAVSVTGNVLTGTGSTYGEGKPITLIASGALSVGGYLSAEQSQTGSGGSGGAVILSGSTVTVSGNLSGLSINTSAKFDYNSNVGGDIQVTATAGDLTLAGGVDASHPSGVSRRGAVALSAPNGKITIGSLDMNLFKTISLQPGASKAVHVTGALTGFTVEDPGPPRKITFPAGCTIGSDIYYMPAANTGIPLTGDYDIWVTGSGDTGKKLMSALARLTITTQPSASTLAGAAFAEQPVVKIVDQYGVVTSGDDATTIVALTLNTGTGTLGGTATMNAVGGVADFAGKGLNINLVGSDKVLMATATLSGQGAKTVLTSPAFAIVPAAASQVVVTTQPSASTVAGVAFAQQPIVTIEDQFGNVVDSGADASVTVVLTRTAGTGTLGGTATMDAVGGVANFVGKGLNINLVGADKQLTATATVAAGVRTATSSAFTITHAAASQLAFTTPPSASTPAGLAFAQQPVVTIQDALGNTVTSGADATTSVALSLTTGTGTLGGTTAMNALAGVADFVGKGLNINQPGDDKVLTATATLTGPGVVTGTTSPFVVTLPPQTIMQFN